MKTTLVSLYPFRRKRGELVVGPTNFSSERRYRSPDGAATASGRTAAMENDGIAAI